MPYAAISYAWDSEEVYGFFHEPFRDHVRRFLRTRLGEPPEGEPWLQWDKEAFRLGEEGKERTRQFVENARSLVFLRDSFSTRSPWCTFELGVWGARPGLIPVLLEKPDEARPGPDSEGGAPVLGRIGLEAYGSGGVPIEPGSAAFAAMARRVAGDIAVHLRPTARVDTWGEGGGPSVFVAPSSGDLETARLELTEDLRNSGVPGLRQCTVDPASDDLVGTLEHARAGIAAADVSVHFFGAGPTWDVAGAPLSLALLKAAIEHAATGRHRVLAWVSRNALLETPVAQLVQQSAARAADVRMCIGTREELRRQVLALLPRRDGGTAGAIALHHAALDPAEVQATLTLLGAEGGRLTAVAPGQSIFDALRKLVAEEKPSTLLLAVPRGTNLSGTVPTLRAVKARSGVGRWYVWAPDAEPVEVR